MSNTRMNTTHDSLWGTLLVVLIVLFAILLRAIATADGSAIRTPLYYRPDSGGQYGLTTRMPSPLPELSDVSPHTQ
jgi:hypothetical protein